MINKQVLPESFDFGMPSVEIVNVGSKGLDKTAMVKRASAFDDVLDKIEKKANRTYLHVITTGAYERYGANANCFVAGTPVITITGAKPIEEIKVGDLVQTDDGSFKPVTRTMSREYTGDMVELKIGGLPDRVRMTANHPVKYVGLKFKQYREYRRHQDRETPEAYRMAYTKEIERENAFIDAAMLEAGDQVVLPKRQAVMTPAELHDPFVLLRHSKRSALPFEDGLFAYIAGLWLAEGCVSLIKKGPHSEKYPHHGNRTPGMYGHGQIVFTLNRENDKGSIELLNAFIGATGFKCYKQAHGAVDNYYINTLGTALKFIELFGRGARNKYIHNAIFAMPDDWKYYFLAGYLDGDGHVSGGKKGCVSCSSVSRALVLDLQALLLTLGIHSSIALSHNYHRNGCFGHEDNIIYSLSISMSQVGDLLKYCQRLDGSKMAIPDKHFVGKMIKLEKYTLASVSSVTKYVQDDPIAVYNLEVEDRHTYCVPFVVHNCDAWNGHAFDHVAPYPEDEQHKVAHFDGGLSKYHDDTYMHGGAVYQEHQTKTAGVEPSGEIIAARYNEPMQRGELIIAVDNDKWRDRLQKKASGHDIYLSIGASVPFDRCLLCHHQAKVASAHCDHFKHHRGQIFDCGEVACVMNDTPSFYDISGVNVPADKIAFVLRKMASTEPELTKTASISHLPDMIATRRPMLLTKAASILSKLAEMEKKIEGIIEGDKSVDLEAFRDDDDAKKDLILRVENYPADEVIDSCNRKGMLLSPGMLFKILGSDLEDGNILSSLDDDCCGDTTCIVRELEDDDEKNEELLDGSFDQHMPADLNLDEILNKFLPEFGTSDGAINAKIIKITISPRDKKSQHKEASYNPMAQQALRRTYARYLVSFAERNDDATCFNALMKVAALSK